MKTALELLGDDAYVGMVTVAGAHPLSSEATHTPEGWVRLLELIAQRAREEMREACAVAAEGVVADGENRCALGPDDCERCEYEANVAKRIRALQVCP